MQNKHTFMEQFSFFLNVIRGIFDSDGSFEAKIYFGTDKPVSFHVNIIFPQKDSSVIEMIMDKLGYPAGSYISPRTHQLKSGNMTQSYSKSIAFSNPAGQRLLKAWQENPPIAPTKFLDFQICLVLVQVNTRTALEVVNSLCPGCNLQDLRIASFALMHLRYQMFGKVKENSNPKLIPIEEHYANLIGNVAPAKTIFYCGSGITAAQNVLAMKHAGFDDCKMYIGSWSEWITDPQREIAL